MASVSRLRTIMRSCCARLMASLIATLPFSVLSSTALDSSTYFGATQSLAEKSLEQFLHTKAVHPERYLGNASFSFFRGAACQNMILHGNSMQTGRFFFQALALLFRLVQLPLSLQTKFTLPLLSSSLGSMMTSHYAGQHSFEARLCKLPFACCAVPLQADC